MLSIFAETIAPFCDYANEDDTVKLYVSVTRVGPLTMRSRHIDVDTKEQGGDTMITVVEDIEYQPLDAL